MWKEEYVENGVRDKSEGTAFGIFIAAFAGTLQVYQQVLTNTTNKDHPIHILPCLPLSTRSRSSHIPQIEKYL